MRYQDATTFDVYSCEIPGANLTLLDAADRGRLDLSVGAGADLVTAFEAYVKSKNGNAVEVLEVIHVGRNI